MDSKDFLKAVEMRGRSVLVTVFFSDVALFSFSIVTLRRVWWYRYR